MAGVPGRCKRRSDRQWTAPSLPRRRGGAGSLLPDIGQQPAVLIIRTFRRLSLKQPFRKLFQRVDILLKLRGIGPDPLQMG